MNYSIDMFNESDEPPISNFDESMIELTLAELKLDSDKSPSCPDDQLINVNLRNMCGPSVRAYLLQKAMLCDAAKVLDAAMFETAALCIWTMYKYQPVTFRNNMVTKERVMSILTETESCNQLLDVCREYIGGGSERDRSRLLKEPRLLRDKVDGTAVLIKRCNELPEQWTVLQMCKGFNPDHGHNLLYDNRTVNLPLNFTFFKYVRSGLLNDEPLRFNIKRNDLNIFKECYDCSQDLNVWIKSGNVKSDLEKIINDVVSDIKFFLGPWRVVFSGKAKNIATLSFEDKIFKMVDKFCDKTKSKTKYTARQRVLLSMIARRTDMLDKELLDKAAWNISQDSTQCTELCTFLLIDICEFVAKEDQTKFAYYPTIVIMDELVDFIYWEMVWPKQEMARMCSMAMFFKLYDKYAAEVKNGYLRVKTNNGYVICNPDNNLPCSQKRLEPLFKTWYPHYTFISGKPPTSQVLKDALNSCDVYIFAGHGSGLQFIGGRDIADCELHCVAFLYGCQSVALKSFGTQCESTGPHLFLQCAMCPAVVGSINIITDSWTDIVTLGLNVMWLPAVDPKFELPESWNSITVHYKRAVDAIKSLSTKESLLEALITIRCMKELPLRVRCTMVYRGLPVARY